MSKHYPTPDAYCSCCYCCYDSRRRSSNAAFPIFNTTQVTCLILVGMMGAGKTTVGRELAKRLNLRFADCDQELIARTGVSVPVIFDIEGEAGFRQRESRLLAELLAEPDIVIATGGGVVLSPANRALLAENGIVIYLNVPPDTLWERTRYDRNRPLLQVENPRERIAELHAQRDPLYRAVADIIINSEYGTCSSMANRIKKALADFTGSSSQCAH